MGMIMSTGVSVANAILIVTNAESLRLMYRDATKAAITSASIRLTAHTDDQFGHDRRYDPYGIGHGRSRRTNCSTGPRSYWRLVCLHICSAVYIANGICLGTGIKPPMIRHP